MTEPVMFAVQSLSHVQLFATPGTAACQASLSCPGGSKFSQEHDVCGRDRSWANG